MSCSLSSPAAMFLPALQGTANVAPAAAEPENIMLSEQPSPEELQADEQYLAGAIAEWLDDEWTPLDVHRELGAAAGQVCKLACVDPWSGGDICSRPGQASHGQQCRNVGQRTWLSGACCVCGPSSVWWALPAATNNQQWVSCTV